MVGSLNVRVRRVRSVVFGGRAGCGRKEIGLLGLGGRGSDIWWFRAMVL